MRLRSTLPAWRQMIAGPLVAALTVVAAVLVTREVDLPL
ncbi:MAG: hypothetical protein JWO90_1094, partial [Solirubrobacterales bacterium]|nr:hypothetical protein [Solirubrobacterales bacterium]